MHHTHNALYKMSNSENIQHIGLGLRLKEKLNTLTAVAMVQHIF